MPDQLEQFDCQRWPVVRRTHRTTRRQPVSVCKRIKNVKGLQSRHQDRFHISQKYPLNYQEKGFTWQFPDDSNTTFQMTVLSQGLLLQKKIRNQSKTIRNISTKIQQTLRNS